MINDISMIIDKIKSKRSEEYWPLLKEVFSTLGIGGQLELDSNNSDFIFKTKNNKTHIVEVKKAMPLRYRGVLEAIAYQQLISKSDISPMVHWMAILTDSLAENAVKNILDFCQAHNIDINILLIDTIGNLIFIKNGHISEQRVVKSSSAILKQFRTSKIAREKSKATALSFSSNQQWIIKHLLLNGIEGKYWAKEHRKLAKSTMLSQVTGVAQSACYDTFKALENSGFIVAQDGDEYKFRKIHELITAWRVSVSNQNRIEVYARPDKPMLSEISWWEGVKLELESNAEYIDSDSKYSISGSAAAAWYGLKSGKDLSVIIHLGSQQTTYLDHIRSRLNLSLSEEQTSIKIILHKNGKSEIGIRRYLRSPYVDLLQLALDSYLFGSRGSEQADRIFSQILDPFWEKKGWSI